MKHIKQDSPPTTIIGSVEPNIKPAALISTNLLGGKAPVTITLEGSQSFDADGTTGSG